ncbi:MAG: ribulose-phosphate 3-epimerase [Armatimonadetes bacterium]|nr:ribulose-phosphate 3-epimerase [Armatimonadota bacterium]
MNVKYAPSLLAADFTRLGEQVREAEDAGADVLHLDVMDGHFVPNISFGPLVVEALRPITSLFFEVHLMIQDAANYIQAFAAAGADRILVHPEISPHLHRLLQQIHDLNKEAGVALNPSTGLETLEYVMTDLDSVLIMTVNPGFGGQVFIPEMLPKIARAREMVRMSGRNIALGVDGGINARTAAATVEAGADLLIAGSSVFNKSGTVAHNLNELMLSVSAPSVRV